MLPEVALIDSTEEQASRMPQLVAQAFPIWGNIYFFITKSGCNKFLPFFNISDRCGFADPSVSNIIYEFIWR
jgi:hypothetical protein